jgi:hypothetical protein
MPHAYYTVCCIYNFTLICNIHVNEAELHRELPAQADFRKKAYHMRIVDEKGILESSKFPDGHSPGYRSPVNYTGQVSCGIIFCVEDAKLYRFDR